MSFFGPQINVKFQLEPPPGWSFTPTRVDLVVDGVSDLCSQGKDIDFNFKGFGITGKVCRFVILQPD